MPHIPRLQFERRELKVPYKKTEFAYDVYTRNMWKYCLQVIRDPLLSQHMHYDAVRLYRYNGKDWERFITEPWTADRMWKLQV